MKPNLEVPEFKENDGILNVSLDQPFRESRGTLQIFGLLYFFIILIFCICLTWSLLLWRMKPQCYCCDESTENSSPNTGALEYCDQVQLCGYVDARWMAVVIPWTMVPVWMQRQWPSFQENKQLGQVIWTLSGKFLQETAHAEARTRRVWLPWHFKIDWF